jgi:hypothetical protein
MAGAAERAYGAHFTYLSCLALHAPVLGLMKGAVLTLCVAALFPAAPHKAVLTESPGPLSAAERRLGAVLVVTLALRMTDAWHGVQPA